MVKLFSAGATHVALMRSNNEDAYVAMPEAGLFALSDGMGRSENRGTIILNNRA
jgi:protein phosphatase